MNVIASIKQFIGLESTEEKLQRFEEIQKAFVESDAKIDELAKDFFIEKANYKARMSEPDNYTIQNKIQEKYDAFITIHKDSIRKAKKQYDSLKKEKDSIEKSLSNHKYIRKEPDGKGGWNYIYDEPKIESNTTEDDFLSNIHFESDLFEPKENVKFKQGSPKVNIDKEDPETTVNAKFVISVSFPITGEYTDGEKIELRGVSGQIRGRYNKDSKVLELTNINVDKELRRKGVGSFLVKKAISEAAKGYTVQTSGVLSDMGKELTTKLVEQKIIQKSISYLNIKKAYQDHKISLDSFNTIIKGITKEEKTKYADFILFNENGEILLLKRSAWEDDNVGAWVIPGGHVDPGEDFETAAIRELREESGYNVTEVENVGSYEDDKCKIEYFQAYVNTKEQSVLLDVFETRDYKWIKLKEVCEQPMVFNMRENLIKILGLQENTNSKTIIRKAILEGLIPIDKILKTNRDNVLKSLYSELEQELVALVNKRNSIIEKSTEDSFVKRILDEEIEKAVKDISKLNKIKKLIYRNGHLIFATYYVKTGETVEEEIKTSSAGVVTEDVVQGDEVTISTKNKKETGIICGFSFHEKNGENWICLQNEDDEKVWFNNKNITEYKKSGEVKEEYTVIKELGGSTGAQLVEDQFGNKYVKKKGKDKSHIDIEYQALKLYNYLGVEAPKIHKYDKENGELYTQYLENASNLNPDNVLNKFKEGFAIDALLANWDVVGLDFDNALNYFDNSDWTYKCARVDVGGSLTKRAQGEDKDFGDEVTELESLLDANINPQTAKVFKGVNIEESIENAIKQYDKAKKVINSDKSIDENIKKTLEKRVNHFRKLTDKKNKPSGLNFNGKLYDVNREEYGDKIADFYDKLNKDLVLTVEDENLLKKQSDYFTEESAKQYFIDKGQQNSGLYLDAISKGITNVELYIMATYTGSSTDFNDLAKTYLETETGNFNFNLDDIDLAGEQTKEIKTQKTIPVESYYDTIFSAIKSMNYALSNGKLASEMNESKYKAALTVADKILDHTKSLDPTTNWENIVSLSETYSLYKKFKENYDKDIKMDNVTKPDSIKNFDIESSETVSVAKSSNGGAKINGFEGKNKYFVAKLKLLCHAIKKMETLITDPRYLKYDTFNRGIDVSSSKADKFKSEHQKDDQLVMHQWGSSSSWKSYGFAKNRNTLIKIMGEGIHINDISKFEIKYGNDVKQLEGQESEVLHRPFQLYRNVSYQDSNPSFENKRTVVLQKVKI